MSSGSSLITGFPMLQSIIGLILTILGFTYYSSSITIIGLGLIGLSIIIWFYLAEKEHTNDKDNLIGRD